MQMVQSWWEISVVYTTNATRVSPFAMQWQWHNTAITDNVLCNWSRSQFHQLTDVCTFWFLSRWNSRDLLPCNVQRLSYTKVQTKTSNFQLIFMFYVKRKNMRHSPDRNNWILDRVYGVCSKTKIFAWNFHGNKCSFLGNFFTTSYCLQCNFCYSAGDGHKNIFWEFIIKIL